jgi:uncharacterized repeat protein (TIGR03803 family)
MNACNGFGCGVVFKMDKSGNETVLHTFTGGADGASPLWGVIRDQSGNLYGAATGGGTSGNGVVYKVDTSGKETVLHNFTGGSDGGSPFGQVIFDGAGSLIGTTQSGGAHNEGVVYKVRLP